MQFNPIEISSCLRELTIYRSKHIRKFSENWVNQEKYLTDPKLYFCFYNDKGVNNLGFFNTYKTKFFALDVDNHNNEIDLQKAILSIKTTFAEPSFINYTERGAHLYYLLTDYKATRPLIRKVEKFIKTIPYSKNIEVKPSSRVGLRVPSLYSIDPDYRKETMSKTLQDAIHYVFEDLVPEVHNQIVDEKKVYIDDGKTIMKGETNSAMCYYVPQWKSCGYSEEESCALFMDKLDGSYTGDCRNPLRVVKRVHSFYKRDSERKITIRKSPFIAGKYKDLIERVINSEVYVGLTEYNKKLRQDSIRQDLIKLLYFYEKNKAIFEDVEARIEHNELYPFFTFEMKRGCTPIPSNMLSKKNFELFKRIGLISLPFGKHYSHILSYCIHYFIDFSYYLRFTLAKSCESLKFSFFLLKQCYNMFEYLPTLKYRNLSYPIEI